ncbi:type 2 isopentenyl-diphosphate Delta-isomerase [Candidatus Woesebacteria bacterium]|nr:MAG: type 2 isopentenyl-diphosphate Delta-isomerase [Candidatus Woesebacteria bacterium]
MRNKKGDVAKRKIDHLKIALSEGAQIGNSGFDNYRFIHNALPEIDFDKIDTSTSFLGKKVNYPFFISCMTGGVKEGLRINRNLAKAAQKKGIAMGVGSQRVAIEHKELESLFKARSVAPSVPLMANVGIVQLNYGFTHKEYLRCVDMIEADALVIHINPIQEIIQPEGDRNWENLLPKLEKVVKVVKVPVIAKEVGFGLSDGVIRRLYNIGIRIFDTAGWGGTNWSYVEAMRGKADRNLGTLFSNWGIPTTESINMAKKVKVEKRGKMTILGSGGVRNGIDIAKAISLGSDMVGLATPFAQAALQSTKEVEDMIDRLGLELKTTMFGLGVNSLSHLSKAQLIKYN